MAHVNVKIVVPIYRYPLLSHEEISLRRMISVLGKYTIVVVHPRSLNLQLLCDAYAFPFEFIAFDASWFASLVGYNQLMLSPEFYRYFLDVNYILICQLDVYVFRDELTQWCAADYDYIGAPWLEKEKYAIWYNKWFWASKAGLYRFLHLKSYHDTFNKIGNGGFSLRKVDTFVRTLEADGQIVEQYRKKCTNKRFNEDVYWALEMPRILNGIRIPDKETAVRFAFDVQVKECFALNGNRLPFAVHGWHYRMKYYQPFIE